MPASSRSIGLRAVALLTAGALPAQLARASAPAGAGGVATLRDMPAEARCLADAIYYEAGREPIEGQEAVAQVILNRLARPGFPKTICGVVYQPGATPRGCQFSFTCDGALRRPRAAALWARAAEIGQRALGGAIAAGYEDAINYHASYVSPRWAASLVLVGRIGAHLFYRSAGTGRHMAAPVPSSSTPAPSTAAHQAGFAPWGLSLYK